MRHQLQDAYDSARRRAADTTRQQWHPILAADEVEPGVWFLRAWDGTPYAIVRALELGGERGYRATTWAERPEDRRLIGYWKTLRRACEVAHARFLRRHGPNGEPMSR